MQGHLSKPFKQATEDDGYSRTTEVMRNFRSLGVTFGREAVNLFGYFKLAINEIRNFYYFLCGDTAFVSSERALRGLSNKLLNSRTKGGALVSLMRLGPRLRNF